MREAKVGKFQRDQSVYDIPLDAILSSLYAYEQEMIKIITGEEGRMAFAARSGMEVACNQDKAIKIEAIEKLNHELQTLCDQVAMEFDHHGPVTCHLFVSPADSKSFPMHKDPDDVLLLVIEGEKTMKVNSGLVELVTGDYLFLPAGTPHCAINKSASKMLSIGLEKFIIDKL
jgi:mannose-6-phosphate isomerase-like protein (cupin superfamily)